MKIRRYRQSDAVQIAQVFFDAVRQGAADKYSQAEREAWAPALVDAETWDRRLQKMHTLVAEDGSGVAGFMTLEDDGHIDLAFVRPDVMGQGVAGALYEALLEAAVDAGTPRLYAEASHLARSFFEKRGWQVIATQTVVRQGVALTNHRMEIMLNSS